MAEILCDSALGHLADETTVSLLILSRSASHDKPGKAQDHV
ncbi:MAG: hypothetical protein ACLQU5_04030 [Isosphaeraceae bacterium]